VAFRLSVPLIVRFSVLAWRRDLDQQLAAGGDPHASPARELRAAQLCGIRTRRGIARRLRGMIEAAHRGSRDHLTRGRVARSEILAEADVLRDLAARLEAPRPVNPMGVALANALVSDANSPLKVGSEPGTLHAVVGLATVALEFSPAGDGAA
jgi:hypothetical protein